MQRASVVIVGGGPAGVSTALFLAHAAPGLSDRIVVLEKARYPREKFCAGAVGGRADRVLATIGVRVDVPSAWVRGVSYRMAGEEREVREADVVGRVVRRYEFDHALAEAARARGIRIVESARVEAIEPGSHGATVQSSQGTFHADVVVGADGVGSVVRRALGLPAGRYRAQAIEVDTPPVDGDPDRDLLFFDLSDRELTGYYWDFPTIVEGAELVCRGVYWLKVGSGRADIEAMLADELRARGIDPDVPRKKRFAERGFELHAPVARPRVLLVGEAAGIDPITGEGIAQAVHYGAAAASYLATKIPDRDFAFEDWAAHLRHHHVGRDLLARTSFVHLIYGSYRPDIERYLLATPECVAVGLQHFAGERWSKAAVARAGASAARFTAGALARRALGFGAQPQREKHEGGEA